MATMAQGHAEFAARIQRIEARGGGVAEIFSGDDRSSFVGRPKARKAKSGSALSFVLKLPVALATGALSFVGAEYAVFAVGDLPEEFSNPDYVLAGQSVIALVLVFIARLFLSLTTKTHLLLSVLGIAAAMSLMHNLVHMAPGQFAGVFSQGWVDEIRATTQPNTLHFRNIDYPLG